MTEDFETILRAGDAEFAARLAPRPAEAVRSRGDRLLRRRRYATAAAAVAVVAAVGGGALVAVGPSGSTAPPASATVGGTTGKPTPTGPTTGSTGAPAPSTTAAPSGGSADRCRSLVVPQSVKDAVTEAYRRSQQNLTHIAPAKGSFFYGTCGDTAYAATRFDPTSGVSPGEEVQLQDAGGAMKYFTRSQDGQWAYVASDGLPRDPRGCAAVPQIPAELARLWAGC
ncbi:hypothetical protein ACL02U_23355 [Streptomyces sp. MS06]|uniref:hypothetical protein n=1 Tax=Streptomyces sp. MS06 TaxID=3385974 RepID=UPI00399F79CD